MLLRRGREPLIGICFCTLAIHQPYRRLARRLCRHASPTPVVVLTDEPGELARHAHRAIRHVPTGPMAVDYPRLGIKLGPAEGAGAYHDKRFALRAALDEFESAIFVDADSRIGRLPRTPDLPPGLALRPRPAKRPAKNIAEHLGHYGSRRLPAFEALARELTGGTEILETAHWCQEDCFSVSRDGGESLFFETWGRAASFLQDRGTYSGEGGVIGLAAACAGWEVDYEALAGISKAVRHKRIMNRTI